MNPKICECGAQGHVIDSRQFESHVSRRYVCTKTGCGKRWSTGELKLVDVGSSHKDLEQTLIKTYSTMEREAVADKLIALAQELLR
jgi:hypothetical protein